MLYPLFQAVRSFRVKEVPPLDAWTLTNLVIQIGINLAVYLLWGPMSLAYLVLAFFFSIGLHPLGARWIQRHYLVGEGEQETFSYYGKLNLLTFNVGYHNEHHDFPSVPWHPAAQDPRGGTRGLPRSHRAHVVDAAPLQIPVRPRDLAVFPDDAGACNRRTLEPHGRRPSIVRGSGPGFVARGP